MKGSQTRVLLPAFALRPPISAPPSPVPLFNSVVPFLHTWLTHHFALVFKTFPQSPRGEARPSPRPAPPSSASRVPRRLNSASLPNPCPTPPIPAQPTCAIPPVGSWPAGQPGPSSVRLGDSGTPPPPARPDRRAAMFTEGGWRVLVVRTELRKHAVGSKQLSGAWGGLRSPKNGGRVGLPARNMHPGART